MSLNKILFIYLLVTIVFLLVFFLLVISPAGVRLRCFRCARCQAVQPVSPRGSGPFGSDWGAVSSDQYLDPVQGGPGFYPMVGVTLHTGVFLLVIFLLIFRRPLEPPTGAVGAQSLRIVSVLWFCTVQDSFVCKVVEEFRGLVLMIHVGWSM